MKTTISTLLATSILTACGGGDNVNTMPAEPLITSEQVVEVFCGKSDLTPVVVNAYNCTNPTWHVQIVDTTTLKMISQYKFTDQTKATACVTAFLDNYSYKKFQVSTLHC